MDGMSISNNFESLDQIGPRARVETDAGDGGGGVGSEDGSSSSIGDTMDGGNLLLKLYRQERAVQTHRPEHKVCLCGCGFRVCERVYCVP